MKTSCPHCGRALGPMPSEEYESRAIPRLQRIDEIDPFCHWDEMFARDERTQRYRDEWNRLMAEQAADEAAAGL